MVSLATLFPFLKELTLQIWSDVTLDHPHLESVSARIMQPASFKIAKSCQSLRKVKLTLLEEDVYIELNHSVSNLELISQVRDAKKTKFKSGLEVSISYLTY